MPLNEPLFSPPGLTYACPAHKTTRPAPPSISTLANGSLTQLPAAQARDLEDIPHSSLCPSPPSVGPAHFSSETERAPVPFRCPITSHMDCPASFPSSNSQLVGPRPNPLKKAPLMSLLPLEPSKDFLLHLQSLNRAEKALHGVTHAILAKTFIQSQDTSTLLALCFEHLFFLRVFPNSTNPAPCLWLKSQPVQWHMVCAR